jgi:hypothetical protein
LEASYTKIVVSPVLGTIFFIRCRFLYTLSVAVVKILAESRYRVAATVERFHLELLVLRIVSKRSTLCIGDEV